MGVADDESVISSPNPSYQLVGMSFGTFLLACVLQRGRGTGRSCRFVYTVGPGSAGYTTFQPGLSFLCFLLLQPLYTGEDLSGWLGLVWDNERPF